MVTSCCDMDGTFSRFLLLHVLAVFYVFESKGYEFNLVNPNDCISESHNGYNYFFDATQLSCVPCNQTSEFQKTSIDGLKCVCQPGFKIKNVFGRYLTCEACPPNQVPSDDGWGCVICDGRNITGDLSCGDCSQRHIAVERQLSGGYADAGKSKCSPCAENTEPNADKSRCVYCGQLLSIQSSNTQCICPPQNLMDGTCYSSPDDISNIPNSKQLARLSYEGMVLESSYFMSHARTSIGQCGNKYQKVLACEQLGNMCALSMYDTSQNTVCGSYLSMILQSSTRKERPTNMPWLFYEKEPSVVLSSLELTETYQFPDSRLNIILAVYHINGSFLGFWKAEDGHLQLCKNTNNHLQAAYLFGTAYEQQCRVRVDELYDPEVHPPLLFDVYIKQDSAGKTKLIDVPVVPINFQSWREDPSKKSLNLDSWKLVRRIYLVDNVVGKQDATTHYVRYAKDIRIVVNLQKNSHDGLIYPPFIEVTYSSLSLIDKDKSVPVSFSVNYAMDTSKHERDIWISFGVLVSLAFIHSVLTTWSWSHRNGQIAIDCWTLIQWFFNLCSSMANAIFIVILMSSLWTTIFFKKQREVALLPHKGSNNDQYLGLLISAFILKFLHLLHLFVLQINVDVFLVDWEKPSRVEVSKAASNEASRKLITEEYQVPSPSVWRMYLVANEWNEIQSYRKLNPAIQLIFTIFFLEVVGFGNIATMDPHINLKLMDNDKYFAPQSHLMRFALIGIVYFCIAFAQLLLVSLCYERFIEDKIQQFVDLCSTCNISVFVFSTELYGFYIHGRCVHGKSDVGLRQMHENFIKEERDLVCKRGLVADDDQQTFEIIVPRRLRSNINKITKPVLYAQNSQSLTSERGSRRNLYESIQAHYAINHLLTSFIDHTLTDIDYIVKKKSLIESILQAEFQPHSNTGSFYRDNGRAFESVLFYGNEITLAIFEVLLFSCIDILFSNYVLDGLATFFFMEVILATLRDSFGKINLARKTMVDNRFLI